MAQYGSIEKRPLKESFSGLFRKETDDESRILGNDGAKAHR